MSLTHKLLHSERWAVTAHRMGSNHSSASKSKPAGPFSFLYLKIKKFKNICWFGKIMEIRVCRPVGRRQEPVAHPRGVRSRSPVEGATEGDCRTLHGRQAPATVCSARRACLPVLAAYCQAEGVFSFHPINTKTQKRKILQQNLANLKH